MAPVTFSSLFPPCFRRPFSFTPFFCIVCGDALWVSVLDASLDSPPPLLPPDKKQDAWAVCACVRACRRELEENRSRNGKKQKGEGGAFSLFPGSATNIVNFTSFLLFFVFFVYPFVQLLPSSPSPLLEKRVRTLQEAFLSFFLSNSCFELANFFFWRKKNRNRVFFVIMFCFFLLFFLWEDD